MNITESFKLATKAEAFGSKTFYAVTAVSAILLVFPKPGVEAILQPVLIVAALVAIACTVVTTIFQAQANRLLRASQLSDALGAVVGEQIRGGYYNSPLPASILRLASTTLENTLFTSNVLSRMLVKERIKIAVYACVLLLLLAFRWTSTGWLLFLAQTLFSADLVLSWVRMERFQHRTARVHEQLHQFFLQDGSVEKPNGMAIVLAAFTDYECAKDEASIPLDGDTFNELNPSLSMRWEEMKRRLKIGLL